MVPLLLLAVTAALAEPADFRRQEQSELFSFEYGWPAAVEAVPALRETLRREMETERTETIGDAVAGQGYAAENRQEFMPHYYAKSWQVAGSTAQLLSLSASTETFSGGAHGNYAYSAILWDLAADAPIEAAASLGADALARMTPRYCEQLDAERAVVRGEPVRRNPHDPFTLCPPLAEQVVVPTDSDGNDRFDTLAVLLAPYIAGPYSEGSYGVEVPFEEADLNGVADGYRPAFEAGAAPEAAAPGD